MEQKTCVLVSACLLGENCKFNGKNNYNQDVVEFLLDEEIVPIYSEILADMPTPRDPAELVDGRVFELSGKDVHDQYLGGVEIIADKKIDYDIL